MSNINPYNHIESWNELKTITIEADTIEEDI